MKSEERKHTEKVMSDLELKIEAFKHLGTKFIAVDERTDTILDSTQDVIRMGEALVEAYKVIFEFDDAITQMKEEYGQD